MTPERTGDPPELLTVYLLCYAVPIGRVRHYVGITRQDRLAARLREHALRRGSRLTAALASRNTSLELAKTWEAANWLLEREIKGRGSYPRICPICRNNDRTLALATVPCPPITAVEHDPMHLSLVPRLAHDERAPQKKRGRPSHRPPP